MLVTVLITHGPCGYHIYHRSREDDREQYSEFCASPFLVWVWIEAGPAADGKWSLGLESLSGSVVIDLARVQERKQQAPLAVLVLESLQVVQPSRFRYPSVLDAS